MPGLMRYAFGPGKANEHTHQHLVASSGVLATEWAGQLSPAEAGQLGRIMEAAWRDQHAEGRALVGATARGGVSGASLTADGTHRDADREHVYHAALSLAPGESFTDEQWSAVAADFVQGMGFTSGPEDTRGATWAAVRHGLTEKGNDHIHVMVNLVRQDGRRVQLPFNDYRLANQVRQSIEQQHDFVTPLHDRGHGVDVGLSLPAYSQKEAAVARDYAVAGQSGIPDRVSLQRIVRAAAATASSEVEFIANVVQHADLDPARWSTGDRAVVTGYRVRLDDQGRWFTATQLAPDLTLQKLRAGWSDGPGEREDAAAVWRGDTPVPTPGASASAEAELTRAHEHLAAWNRDLAQLDPTDKAAWKRHTAHAGVVMSALSIPDAPFTTQLGPAADQLTRWGLPTKTGGPQPEPAAPMDAATPPPAAPVLTVGPGELAARQIMLAVRATDGSSARGWYAVLEQMNRATRAIRDAQTARSELVAARACTAHVTAQLQETITQAGGATQTVTAERDLTHLSAEDREALQASAPGHTPGAFTGPARDTTQDWSPRGTEPPERGQRRGHGQ
ncbi:relaxase/mobilization nuclease domain-containing protein [Allobranchiibius huperziae]|uniref:MobA/VirD2-like nuclease domain-containing protein n=1 Tax=Allobranchiibius huperziae TaxID=1874116 RepID=A0A853DII0_9MICO|nr:relaxase/mobilization nuclease domain-containing protein [Allobranchiibius huperziae]NYJ76497.1 hypothetical protein [Allobranchiibius huperziae]